MSFWDKLGQIIHQRIIIAGRNGYEVEPTADGKMPVEASITVGSVSATDVTIKDATNPANKQKVNADGSIPVQLTGSNVEQTIGSAIPAKAILMGASDGVNIRPITGNLEGTLLANAARTANVTGAVQTNYFGKGVIISLDITASSGTGGLRVSLVGIDPVSGGSYSIMLPGSTPITAVGRYAFEISPGLIEGAIASAAVLNRVSSLLPRKWRVDVFHSDSSSYTYSVGYSIV